MNELNRPYSKEDHERLLTHISVQKPVQNYKDLRGGIKTYEEDRVEKSFLDHNLNLAKEIEAAHDDPLKELYLLRGFFFWLSVSILRQYVFLCIYLKIFNFNTLQDVSVEKYVARGG
ncbi:hypothetical protein QL285_091954 [Trifolium repens]|nr:hypothetical protein QL285_091954 [Trifolium repens]